MRKMLSESFIPILAVLGLLFLLLLYVRYQVVLEADEVTVITIQKQQVTHSGDELVEQELTAFGNADPELDAITDLLNRQEMQQAEQRLKQLLQQRNDSRTLATLGILRYKQKRYDDALNNLEKAATIQPPWPGLYFYRAMVYNHTGAMEKASADYREIIKINPNHFEAHYNFGLLLIREKSFTEATNVFQRAVNLAGGSRKARAHYQLGRALMSQGDTNRSEAEKQFKTAIRHLPGYIEPRLALAKMEPDSAEGRKAAEEQLLTVLNLAQGNPPALFALAQHYNTIGDNASAIQRYRELLQFEPEHSIGRYNLGLLLLDEKRWQEARSHFNWLIEREPQNPKAYFNRGRTDYRLKQYDSAIADYRKAIELQQGNYPEAYLNIGLVQTATKDYASAEQSYRKALTQRSDYATAWYNLGRLYMRQKRTDEAVKAFKQAVGLNKRYASAWFNLGVLYGRNDQNEEAIKAYQEAIRLRPKYTSAQLNLAVRWMRAGKPQKAIEQYRATLAVEPTYSSAWYNLGLAYTRIGEHENAYRALQRVLELEPEHVAALEDMAGALMAMKRYQEAVAVLDQALDIKAEKTSLRLALAKSLREMGDVKRARSEIYKGLALEPEHQALREELASLEQSDINGVKR